jgi:glycosyltransferase involved in cell wall biosynthesis
MPMLITVFTPSYNRAHLLPRVYESLCRQTFRDFEWVIVDDGSTDDTESVVNSQFIMHNSQFPVRYFYQENGGKHRAINHGVRKAQGELFLILDSDDTLPPNALERIAFYYQQIKDDSAFGGVCGYMAHHNGTVIGKGCDIPVLDTNSIELRYKYHVEGDMLEVFRTSVLKEIPFPETKDEKFVPEVLVWNRIACNYKLRVFHEVVYNRDYLDGGLTDKIVKIRMNSPVASMMTYAELNSYDIPFLSKVKAAINYWRFRFCSDAAEKPRLAWWYHWTMPLGYVMHLHDNSVTS